MAWQCELSILGGTGVQDMEQDALAFLYADGFAIAQGLAVDGESLVAAPPPVRLFLLLLESLRFALRPSPDILRFNVLAFHAGSPLTNSGS